MRGGARPGAGRKRIEIDLLQLERLSSYFSTDEEAAALLGISLRTLESRKKQAPVRDAMARGRSRGSISLRRRLVQSALDGNVTALIFLAKSLKPLRNPTGAKHSEPNSGPRELTIELIDDIANRVREAEARQALAESEDANLIKPLKGGSE